MQHKLMLVEDDASISDMIVNYLEQEGFTILCAYDGDEALRLFQQQSFDLILLDLMLPRLNGMDLLPMIREKSTVPVLIISVKNSDADKALGLGFGADDYITKPFSMIELTARVKSIIRRVEHYSASPASSPSPPLQIHDLTLDTDNRRAYKHNTEIQLTAKEWAILELLITYPKKIFTKEDIYRRVWNDDYYGDDNVINVHIRRLREKIEDDPSSPQYIQTLWGIGYKLGAF